jgi:serine/threonine protein kinase
MQDRMPPGFEAVGALGKGAMGRVYKAWQPKLQRFVAIKTCNIAESRERGQDPGRLEDEALTIARLNHPNIVALYDVFRDEEAIHLVMELLDGQPLSRLLNPMVEVSELGELGAVLDREASEILPTRPRIVADRWLCEIGIAVARALDYAHSRGVLHRDVKPGNIVITNDHHIKLLDFSIARDADKSGGGRTATGTIFGTVAYMSPEQVLGQQLDGRTDIYSLGCTLFHCATGRVPYDDPNDITVCMNHVNAEVPDPRLVNPMLRDNIGRVILRCMAKRPEDRFESPGIVAAMLGSVLRGDTVSISLDHVFKQHLPPPVQSTPSEKPAAETVNMSAPTARVSSKEVKVSLPSLDDTGERQAPPVARRGATTLEGLAEKSRRSPTPSSPQPVSQVFAEPALSDGDDYDLESLPSVRETLDSTVVVPRQTSAPSRRKFVLGGVVGAVALLLLIVVFARSGGGKAEVEDNPGVVAHPTATPTPTPAPTAAPDAVLPTATPAADVAVAITPTPTPRATPSPTPMALPPLPEVSPAVLRFRVPLAEGVELALRELPAGGFVMGSPGEEFGRTSEEGPRTTVRFAYPFYMSETEITRAQWHTVMGTAGTPGEESLPMDNVSWEQAMAFCRRLTERTGITFTLPTEAQWEYACRAGTTTPFAFGPILTSEIANIDGTRPYPRAAPSEKRNAVAPVRSYPPNAWGLYDMHGNVREWVRDTWSPSLPGREATNPVTFSANETRRVLRGGGYQDDAAGARSAVRRPAEAGRAIPTAGFRVVAEL